MKNQMTYNKMAGKSEAERDAAATMLTILERSDGIPTEEVRNITYQGSDAEKHKTKGVKQLLYAILALNTSGRAKQIVKETAVSRNGLEAWVRLRERFGKTTGATSYAEIFKYNWTTQRSFEDKWRDWGEKMSRLPAGSLSDAARESLAIEGANMAQQTALEQHLTEKPTTMDEVGEDSRRLLVDDAYDKHKNRHLCR